MQHKSDQFSDKSGVLSPISLLFCLKVHLMTDSELEDVHYTSDKAVVSPLSTPGPSGITDGFIERKVVIV